MDRYHWQGLTFQQRALYELKQEWRKRSQKQFKKRRRTYWVKVLFTDDKEVWYQCSQDLQRALWQYTGKHGKLANLNGVLLNVPVAPYIGNMTPIRTVKVLETKVSRKHIKDTALITRGQFIKVEYNHFGFPKRLDSQIKYMQHDYLCASKHQIEDDIRTFVARDSNWLYRLLVA